MTIIEKIKLLFQLNKLWSQMKEVKTMKNYRTTIAGLVATLGLILKLFKVDIPDEVSTALITIGVFAVGFFAKDSSVSGTGA